MHAHARTRLLLFSVINIYPPRVHIYHFSSGPVDDAKSTSIFLIVENGIIDYIKKNYKIPPPSSYSTVSLY